MKTHKRDKVERAYHLGYKAGIRGKAQSVCPYFGADARGSWMGGWREGRADFRSNLLDLEDL